MKQFIAFLLSVTILSGFGIKAEEFEFINKLNVPVEIALGSLSDPILNKYKAQQLPLIVIPAGEKHSAMVDNAKRPQLLIRQEDMPLAYVYEFTAKPGKKIYVRLVEEKQGSKLEPQSFVFNSLTKEDIKVLSSVGDQCPVNPNDQSDLSVLGFAPNANPTKKEIQKAYDARVKRCTTANLMSDETARMRLERLNKAYERLKK